jgi:hypothetical protein
VRACVPIARGGVGSSVAALPVAGSLVRSCMFE